LVCSIKEEADALLHKSDRAQAYAASQRAAATLPDPTSTRSAAAAGPSTSDPQRVGEGAADDDANDNDGSNRKGTDPNHSSANADATRAGAEENTAAHADDGADGDGDAESAPLVANVCVYALTEYYDVPPLKAHALDKLLARVARMGSWPADGLVRALHLAEHLVRKATCSATCCAPPPSSTPPCSSRTRASASCCAPAATPTPTTKTTPAAAVAATAAVTAA
jgi:hypothetical protein